VVKLGDGDYDGDFIQISAWVELLDFMDNTPSEMDAPALKQARDDILASLPERGETMVRYLEFLGKELRLRRAKYNLTLQDKALVICKDATVHTDARFSELRLLRRVWLRKALGGANNLAFGRQHQDLQFDLEGEINMQCPLLVSLASDVYAMKALGQHRDGNVSLAQIGLYVSAEELAKLCFDGGMDAVATAMSHVQGSMSTLFNLDVLPELGLEAAAQDLDSSVVGTALHSKRHVWWIHDEADRCLPLPTWTSRLVELTIMAWVKERQACPFREERLSAEAGAAFRLAHVKAGDLEPLIVAASNEQ
ncbi:unnamed protein product, partial [Symbiodinium necroappetens]